MQPTLGLTTYRQNNNIKSILLLAAFPVLLLVLLGGIFFAFGFLFMPAHGHYADTPFDMFGLTSVLGIEAARAISSPQWWNCGPSCSASRRCGC